MIDVIYEDGGGRRELTQLGNNQLPFIARNGPTLFSPGGTDFDFSGFSMMKDFGHYYNASGNTAHLNIPKAGFYQVSCFATITTDPAETGEFSITIFNSGFPVNPSAVWKQDITTLAATPFCWTISAADYFYKDSYLSFSVDSTAFANDVYVELQVSVHLVI